MIFYDFEIFFKSIVFLHNLYRINPFLQTKSLKLWFQFTFKMFND